MSMAEVRVKGWGNSLGIIIPKDVAHHDGLKKGDLIKVDILKGKKKDGFGMFKGISSFKEDEEEHEDLW